MARCVNKVTLIGNVGSDPEIRTTQSGVKVAKISLATSKSFLDGAGQKKEETQWHRLTFWDKLAGIAEQYVHKGSRIYIEGEIKYSQSNGADGVTKYFTDIHVRDLTLLDGAPQQQAAAPAQQQRQATPPPQRQAAPAAPATQNMWPEDMDF